LPTLAYISTGASARKRLSLMTVTKFRSLLYISSHESIFNERMFL
jgi:hypothetical protein